MRVSEQKEMNRLRAAVDRLTRELGDATLQCAIHQDNLLIMQGKVEALREVIRSIAGQGVK